MLTLHHPIWIRGEKKGDYKEKLKKPINFNMKKFKQDLKLTAHSMSDETTSISSNKQVGREEDTYFAQDFIEKLCARDQRFRYNARTALKHPWITRRKYE